MSYPRSVSEKKGNGHDPMTARMVEVLERIEKDLSGLREDVRATNARLDALREEVQQFRVEVHDELVDLHAEQHELRMDLRTSVEARLARLEAAVFRPTGT